MAEARPETCSRNRLICGQRALWANVKGGLYIGGLIFVGNFASVTNVTYDRKTLSFGQTSAVVVQGVPKNERVSYLSNSRNISLESQF